MAAISEAQIVVFFSILSLDGLRKAAELSAIPAPDRQLSQSEQKAALTTAFMEKLRSGTLAKVKPPLAISTDAMWATCKALSPPPLKFGPDDVPVFNADAVTAHFEQQLVPVIAALGPLQAICAGKASSDTATAERSGLSARWRGRYGLADHAYTHMMRFYVDGSASTDYRAREVIALAIEEKLFSLLKTRFPDIVSFSNEPGRVLKLTPKPGWQVMVYLALKVAAQ